MGLFLFIATQIALHYTRISKPEMPILSLKSKMKSIVKPDADIFSDFLNAFKSSMERAFHEEHKIDQFCSTRGIPVAVLKELMSVNPLSLCIPKEYGGMGGDVKKNLDFLSVASYESLALSLMLGINNGLFIQPVAKYGQESVKQIVFGQFLSHNSMGGLMITEPNYGSDALNMQTSYTKKDSYYHLKGKKHWAGLTGMADYWLLTARKRSESGFLLRDIEIFICDVHASNQKVEVEEFFENLGLYQIPYGRNHIDVLIPENQRLIPKTNGIQMLLDLLHRSRFQFPGMGLGFVKRMLDEAILHTQSRQIGSKKLYDYDQVQYRLSRLKANVTICSAFNLKSGEIAGMEHDLSASGLHANITKCIVSDMMQDSAQSLLQLVGAKGYQLNHIAGRSVVDSRPFQIFEGSNDILYQQIAESVLKMTKAIKQRKFSLFLQLFTPLAADSVRTLTDFEFNFTYSQRKLVELGRMISRVVAFDNVLYQSKFNLLKEETENAIQVLKDDISMFLYGFGLKGS